MCQQFSPQHQCLHVLWILSLYLSLPCASSQTEFSLTFIFISSSSHPPIPLCRSSHICFSTPLHLPLLSRAANSPRLSSYTIISPSCTCCIAHCSTVELELCKEKTDYLLSCKITTRLFPVCWPGQYLGDKQQYLLFFSLPRIPFTFSWLLLIEWIINHFVHSLRVSALEVKYTLFSLKSI